MSSKDSYTECNLMGTIAKSRDSFECFSFNLTLFLEYIGMGYICITISVIIILISLFSKIKENYRWFILNQTLWNLFLCYDFICDVPTLTAFDDILYWTSTEKCIYSGGQTAPGNLINYIAQIKTAEPCIMTFLLSLSRFLAVCYPFFYKRWDTRKITLLAIAFFDISFVVIVNLANVYKSFTTTKTYKRDIFYIFYFVRFLFIHVCMISSIIFTGIILTKMIKTLLSGAKNKDHKQKLSSLRVTFVLFFQVFTISINYSYIAINDVFANILPNFRYYILGLPMTASFPQWLTYFDQKTIAMIRVLFDSLIVLTILTGYRESLRHLSYSLIHPVKTFKDIKSKTTSSNVSVLSRSVMIQSVNSRR